MHEQCAVIQLELYNIPSGYFTQPWKMVHLQMVYLLKIGGSFHGYVSHNQMVILIQMFLSKTIAVLRFVGALGHCPSVSPFTLQFAPRHGWFLDTKIRMVMAAFPGFKAIVIPECFFITRQLKNHKQWNLGEFQHPHINYWVSLEQC